jgi:acetylornithine deacetylase/succinyl-diaminopimelate desuccinylase-like protein
MKELMNRLLDLAITIQQIPAPTFHEERRAGFLREAFVGEKLRDVAIDPAGNVLARLEGKGQAKPVIVSAHMDTVFSESVSLHVTREPERIFGPGIGDNSLGVAALFGLLWSLRERKVDLPGDVWFAANVGEEGLGDLRGMKALVERFGAAVQAYLVLEGMALGHVYHRAIGVRRYRVTARTAGGHAWSDFGRPSAVHELASLVTQITALPIPPLPRTTLNVGRISGGSGINVVAAEASFELDLRSEAMPVLGQLVQQVEDLIRLANRDGVTVEAEVIGERPAGEIASGHALVRLAAECLRTQGLEAHLTSGSTDANAPLSRGYPAIVLGISTGGGAHTVHEYIDTPPVEKGMEQILEFMSKVWG